MSKQMRPKPIARNPIAAHSMETQSKNPSKSRVKPAKRICYRNSINNIKDHSLFAELQAGKPIWDSRSGHRIDAPTDGGGRFRGRALSQYYLTASVVRWFGVSDGDGFIRLASRPANSHPLQMIISLEIRASSSASIAWSRVTHSRENGRSLANSASPFWLIGFGSSVFARVRFVTGRLGSRPRPSQAKR